MKNGLNGYSRLSQDEEDKNDNTQLELREESDRRLPKGVYFSDDAQPAKRIDYVLVYETNQKDQANSNDSKQYQRKAFEDCLRKEGLNIEYDEVVSAQVGLPSLVVVLIVCRALLFIMNCQFSFLLCLNTHDNGGKDDAFQLYMLLEITLRKKQNCMLYRNDQYCQASHNNIIDLMLIFHCLSHKPFGASSVNARLETYNSRGQ